MNHLSDIREQARERADEQPSNKAEDWRYVDLKRLDHGAGSGDLARPAPSVLADLAGLALGPGGHRVLGELPAGCRLSEPAADSAVDPAWAEAVLAGDLQRMWSLEGAIIDLHIERDPGRPLLLLDNGGRHRLRVKVGSGVTCDLVVAHQLQPGEAGCSGIDLELAAGSMVRVDELAWLADDAQLLADCCIRQHRDAKLTWTQLCCGAGLVRHSWRIDLCEEGAEARLAAATDLHGDRQSHQLLRVNHLAPRTTSDQCFRCVADDGGRASFDGLVHIAANCEEAHAEQQSGNLELSPQARIFTRPQLDIHCDDVVAAHGATIGQPDEGEQFYLRSRGLSEELATQLVIRGFTDDIVHRLHSRALKDLATQHTALSDWLTL